MNDINTDCCPICFSEYTLESIHRPVALKCGHIFGNQCILNWSSKNRTLLCPTCFSKNRKNDIRILYGTSVKVYEGNKQNDAFEKYLDATKKIEEQKREILHLKTCIDYLQAETKRLEELQNEQKQNCEVNVEINNRLKDNEYIFKKKIAAKNTYCIVINEVHTNKLFYTARTIDSIGYKVVDLYTYEVKYVKVFDKVIEQSFVSDFKLSPYNDGFLLMSYHKSIKLLNSITNNLLTEIKLENIVVSVSFDNKDRTAIYFMCNKGFLYFYDLISLKILQKLYITDNLLCVGVFFDEIYVNSVFDWFCVSKLDKKITKLEMPENYRCSNIFTNIDAIMLTLKDKNHKTLHYCCTQSKTNDKNKINSYVKVELKEDNDKFVRLLTREVQFLKSRDKIYENKVYIKNEFKNTIEVYCLQNLVNIRQYIAEEKILDFDISQTTLSIVTNSSIIVYKKEKQK